MGDSDRDQVVEKKGSAKVTELDHIGKRLDGHDSEIIELRKEMNQGFRDLSHEIRSGMQEAVKQAINAVGARRTSDSPVGKIGNGETVAYLSIIIALGASLIGFAISGIGKDTSNNREDLHKISIRLEDHMAKSGHPETVMKIAESNTRNIESIKDWSREHDKEVSRLNAMQNNNIEWLVKALDLIKEREVIQRQEDFFTKQRVGDAIPRLDERMNHIREKNERPG